MPTRREFLKSTAASAAVAALGGKLSASASPSAEVPAPKPEIEVFITDATRHHQRASALRWTEGSATAPAAAVIVDPAAQSQPVLGFGGALTDAACYVIHDLPQP